MPLQQSPAEGHFFVRHLIPANPQDVAALARRCGFIVSLMSHKPRQRQRYRTMRTGARRSKMGSGLK
jgi:hypothetical protein